MPAAKFEHGTAASGIIGGAVIEYFTNEACTDRLYGRIQQQHDARRHLLCQSHCRRRRDNFACTFRAVYSFTVNYAQLTITAENDSIVYNSEIPDYTATITGFVNGETAESLGIDAGDEYTIECEYRKGSSVNTYVIDVSGDSIIGNYQVVYVDGTLTVTAQRLVLHTSTMNDVYCTYKGVPIPYLVTATGAEDGEEVELIIYYNGSTTIPTNAGTYTVTFAPAAGRQLFRIRTDRRVYYHSARGRDRLDGNGYGLLLQRHRAERRHCRKLRAVGKRFDKFRDGRAASLADGGRQRIPQCERWLRLLTASFSGGSYSDTYGYLSADGNYRMAETNGHRTQGYTIAKRPITVTVTPQTAEYGDGYAIPDSAVSRHDDGVGTAIGAVIGGDTAYRLQVQDAKTALP